MKNYYSLEVLAHIISDLGEAIKVIQESNNENAKAILPIIQEKLLEFESEWNERVAPK